MVYRRKHTAVAHWHFDEGNGTIAHDVDGGNNGTLGNGEADKTPAWALGCGGGFLFDGVNDLVKVPDSDALDLAGDELTITTWAKRSSAGSGYLVKKSDASNGYRLWVTVTGTLQFEVLFSGTTKTVTSTTTIPVNEWKHLSARYDGSELRVFIDGAIESATTAVTGTLVAMTEPLWIGADTPPLNGTLDDLSIYSRALSDAEISNLSNNRVGRYEYHYLNAWGSNIVLTDDNQNPLVRYEYDVFGAIRNEVGASDNTRKFTGKEWDADSNLYYFAARYYDPYIGRFTQRDPIGGGVNWYTYNNPLKYTDPNGKEPVKDQAGTVDGFIEEFDNLNSDSVELSDFVPSVTGSDTSDNTGVTPHDNRYIYTEEWGWIDMKHFLAAAGTAFSYIGGPWYDNPILERAAAYVYATALGYALELEQYESDKPTINRSGFSYEDLPSNAAGAKFGAHVYDPNSGVSVGQQIADWINNEAQAMEPEQAPNYNLLPATESKHNPDPPKNFIPKPYKFPTPDKEDGG